MKDDKIVGNFSERIKTLQISPVIVKTKSGTSFRSVLQDIVTYNSPLLQSRRKIFSGEMIPNLFPIISMRMFQYVAGILPRNAIFDLAENSNVSKIYPNSVKFAFQYPKVPDNGSFYYRYLTKKRDFTTTLYTKKLMGLGKAQSLGFTGRGVKVAVIDTGTSRIHPQVRGRVNFKTQIKVQYRDENGHGTHVSTTIMGSKAKDIYLSKKSGKNIYCEGMAPDAILYSMKALGFGMGIGSDGAIIKGIEESIKSKCQVVNMSLGGSIEVEKPEDDPYYDAILKLREKNIIPVCAAGNSGPKPSTIDSPGWFDDVLCVGSYDPLTGKIADYSSRGPTKDGRVKPDVIAPGSDINSGCVGLLDFATDKRENRYAVMSGSSMATPHITGLLVAARQAYPNLTLDDIFNILRENGKAKSNECGYGVLTWDMIQRHFEA